MLGNRALWSAIGALLLCAAFACFRPDREGLRLGRRRAREPAIAADSVDRDAAAAAAERGAALAPPVILRTDAAARWAQFLWLARFETRAVLLAVAFLVMLAFGLMNLGATLAFSNEIFGTKAFPVTHLMMEAMDGSYNLPCSSSSSLLRRRTRMARARSAHQRRDRCLPAGRLDPAAQRSSPRSPRSSSSSSPPGASSVRSIS